VARHAHAGRRSSLFPAWQGGAWQPCESVNIVATASVMRPRDSAMPVMAAWSCILTFGC
jgi:hypothetical protein